MEKTVASKYMDLRFIVPTSNMCERLFSEAGYGHNYRRMRSLPSNFEAQLFLRTNKELWDIPDINSLINDNQQDGEE
jgi:hypothetical protein